MADDDFLFSLRLTRCCDLFHFDFVCSCPHPDGCREENIRNFMWELHKAQYSFRYLLVRGRSLHPSFCVLLSILSYIVVLLLDDNEGQVNQRCS